MILWKIKSNFYIIFAFLEFLYLTRFPISIKSVWNNLLFINFNKKNLNFFAISRSSIDLFFHDQCIVKLSKIQRLPNRIKYEFVTANHTRTFLLFLCFFCKKFGSVRSKRTSKLTEYDAFKWWRNWIMFNWSIRFDRAEPNFLQKNTKTSKWTEYDAFR